MRVKMKIEIFDKDKKLLGKYSKYDDAKFFRFNLQTCNIEITSYMGSYELDDNEFGNELSVSDLKELVKGIIYNHQYGNITWGYREDIGIFIYANQAIDI